MAHGDWPTRKGERIPGTEYVLDEMLGQGRLTLASRVLAQDGAPLVLKVLLPHVGVSAELAERFVREARLFASFEHEHLLALVDVGRITDGRPFFASPLVHARLLAHDVVARNLPVPLDQALAVGVQLTDALGAVHAAGAIHRAVHPGNVLLGWSGHVWLQDFGIDAGQLVPAVTTPGELYLEPRPAGSAGDPRGDLFALGCVLYELCGGGRPYPAGDRVALAARLRAGPPDPPGPSIDGRALPKPLVELLVSLVAAEPTARPASVWQVREVLRAVAAKLAPPE